MRTVSLRKGLSLEFYVLPALHFQFIHLHLQHYIIVSDMNLMRNTMEVSQLLLLFLFIVHCPKGHSAPLPLDTMLVRLDKCLEESKQYVDRKEKQIAGWRLELGNAVSDEKQYEACIHLFNEYKSYKYDSAYAYANKCLHLAEKLNNRGYVAEANGGIVFCLLSSGLFKEAFDVISKIDITNIPLSGRIAYYSLHSRLYYDIADYNHEAPFQDEYIEKGSIYTDSLLNLLPEKSLKWWYAMGQKQMKERQYDASISSFNTLLQRKDIDPHTQAIVSSSLGWMYYEQGDKERAMAYLMQAAIGDIRSATKETTALRVLAGLLYEWGDINRANKYVKIALEDANFYNARHRKIEIGSILPIIEQDRFDIMKKQRNVLIGFGSLVSLLFILLLTATLIIYKQVKKLRNARHTIEERNLQLQETNEQLSEANNIKDEYIGYSFYLNSEYIDKMESLYKMINRKIAARQYEDLRTSFKEANLNKERDNMYASFDETFLKLFPGFIASYNMLFPAEEHSRSDNEKSLTPEMRIFALIRLGICETERIAKFLNYSIHTINTYKTRVKNKSLISNELFEAKIMEIASVTPR